MNKRAKKSPVTGTVVFRRDEPSYTLQHLDYCLPDKDKGVITFATDRGLVVIPMQHVRLIDIPVVRL